MTEPNRTTATVDDEELPYVVTATVEATDTGPALVVLELHARPGAGPITAVGLRAVPLGRVVRAVTDQAPATSADDRRARSTARRAVTRAQNTPGRWVLDAATLARVAEVYRTALTAGQPPTVAVQEFFGLTSQARAARWVKRAREEGHLGAAPGRRRQGERTGDQHG